MSDGSDLGGSEHKDQKELHGRSRQMRGDYVLEMQYTTGEQVTASVSRKDTMGPAKVINVGGSNLWESHRATAIKCSKEQVRTASRAEKMREGNARNENETWCRRPGLET